MKIERALLSTYDKTGIAKLARGLQELGIELISTEGTADYLEKENITVRRISELTGYPELLNGRVKSLHPNIHAGILASRSNSKHMRELENRNILPIDLIVVNLYPFRKSIERGDSLEDAVENIDIGGPTLIRSAAKNYEHVTVIVKPEDYNEILEELKKNEIEVGLEAKKRLAAKAFAHTARYEEAIKTRFQKEVNADTSKREKNNS